MILVCRSLGGRSNTRTFLWPAVTMGRHRRGGPCLFKVHAGCCWQCYLLFFGYIFLIVYKKSIPYKFYPFSSVFLPLSLPDTTTVYGFQSLPGIAGLFRMASPLAASHIRAHKPNRYSIRSELLWARSYFSPVGVILAGTETVDITKLNVVINIELTS